MLKRIFAALLCAAIFTKTKLILRKAIKCYAFERFCVILSTIEISGRENPSAYFWCEKRDLNRDCVNHTPLKLCAFAKLRFAFRVATQPRSASQATVPPQIEKQVVKPTCFSGARNGT